MTLEQSHVEWKPCWRLIPSRFLPVGLFDRVAHSDDLEAVFAIEALTNDRLRDQTGEITLVPEAERVSGPGTAPIMAAFTHLNTNGSRFTDGAYGVYYAAKDIDTAITETRFHRERFLAATDEPPIEIDMRSYASDIDVILHDLRGMKKVSPEFYNPDPVYYAAPQALAAQLRKEGANGLVYDSVRHEGGECVAIFRPSALSPVRQGIHFCYVWDGQTISTVYKKTIYS